MSVSLTPFPAQALRRTIPRRYLLDGRELTGSLAVRITLDWVRRLGDDQLSRLAWSGCERSLDSIRPHRGSNARAAWDRLFECFGKTAVEAFLWRVLAQETERRRQCPRCYRDLSAAEARLARYVGTCSRCGPGPEEGGEL